MYLKYILLLHFFVSFAEAELYSRTKVLMGTFITISTSQENKQHIEKCFDIISDIEMSLSSYNEKALLYYTFQYLSKC